MKHLKSIEEFKAVNEQLFGNFGKTLSDKVAALFGGNNTSKTGTSNVAGASGASGTGTIKNQNCPSGIHGPRPWCPQKRNRYN